MYKAVLCARASNRRLNQPPDGGKKRGERLGFQSMGELDAAMRLEWGRNELGFGKVGSQERRLAYKAVPPDP